MFGASVRLAKEGKPEAVNGSEHAARNGLTILKAVRKAMKHEDGAFKVKISAACGMFPAWQASEPPNSRPST